MGSKKRTADQPDIEGMGILETGGEFAGVGRRYIDTAEARAFIAKGMREGLKKPSELMKFLVYLTGEAIPHVAICEDHQTPWDFVRAIYFDEVQSGIAVGMRGGYKTTSMAALNAAELLTKPGVQVASMAAIDLQAKRCYKLTVGYLQHPYLMEQGIFVKPPTLFETELTNGSRYTSLAGTLRQTNSPHPNRLRVDEVELMDAKVLEELVMMPASYGGHKKSILYVSSRKSAMGNVQGMLESRSNMPRWVFCWKDVVEKCGDGRSGIVPARIEVEDIYLPGNKITFDGFDGCRSCKLAPACMGVAKRGEGRYPIDDLISEFMDVERQVWLAQKECRVVERRGLRFPDFDENLNVGDYRHDAALPCDVTVDFGAAHATAILWVQEDGPDYYVVHEQFHREQPSDFHSREAWQWTRDNGIRVRDQIGDQQARQQMIDFNANSECRGFWNLRGTKKPKTKDIWQSELARLIRDPSGKRHLFIDAFCKNLIRELKTFRYKHSNSNETVEEGDDCLSALGYLRCHRLRKGATTIAEASMSVDGREPMAPSMSDPEIEDEREKDRKDLNYSVMQEVREYLYAEEN